MAPANAFSGSNVFSSQSAPTKRAGQSDGVQKGALASSVNLFKGDVDLNHPLISLKGRAPGGGDTLKLSIQYASNTRHNALTWNPQAPTGTLGLGWGLAQSVISLAGDGGPTPSDASYTISDNGVSSTLVRQNIVPTLLTGPASLLDNVTDGQTVPADLRALFTENGLPLSATAILQGGGDDWTLRDDALEQEYALTLTGADLAVQYGGAFYQLQNYSFKHIVFFDRYDRWVVIDESGTRRSFGGGVTTTDHGLTTSRGNAVSWSVWWTDANGRPTWSGAGASTTGQTNRANAWYLENVTDRFGNTQRFGYNAFPRDPDTGLLQYCEQQLAEGGLAFTKAVYLTSATDVFGRQVTLSYAPKLWSPTGAQEYSDPHADTPPLSDAGYFTPTGYQDAYEVLYLSGLTATGTDGTQIMRYAFDYEPVSGSPVAYIGGTGGAFAKRLLTEITKYDSADAPVPGLDMAYCLDADPQTGQPGALTSLTGASGGTVTYRYTKQALGQSNRTIDVSTDGADQTNLYYGPDYAVMALYNSSTTTLSLRLLNWNGTWQVWQPAPDGTVATGNIDLTTLECQPAQDFVVLSYMDFNGTRYVYVWNKCAAQPGQWQSADQLGLDYPITYPNANSRKIGFYTGAAHFLIADQNLSNPSETGNAIARYSWRWDLDQWLVDQVPLDNGGGWIAPGDNLFSVYSNNDQTLRLYWRNPDQSWCDTPSALPMPGASATNDWNAVALAGGASSVAFTKTVATGTNMQAVQLSSVAWDSAYALTGDDHGTFTDYYDASIGNPLTTTATVVSDSMITLNSNALRRTATGWDKTSLITSSNYQNFSQSFVAGPDVIGVMTTNKSNATYVTLQSWQPGLGWGAAQPVQVNTLVPGDISPADTRNNFNLSGDWLNVGALLYYRGTSCDWNAVLQAGPAIDMVTTLDAAEPDFSWLNSKSLLNSAPNFVALDTVDSNGNGAVSALIFQNGAATPDVTALPGRSLFDGGQQGQSAASQSDFATTDLSGGAPSALRFHRYQNYDIDGPVTHYTVSGATLDDAMGDITHMAYDCVAESALCSSTGDDVSFHETHSYPGTDDPANTPFGSVETRYFNAARGADQDNFYDLLEGQQIAQITRDANGQIVAASTTHWDVRDRVGADPITRAIVPLRGGWARAVEKTESEDCVTQTTVMLYENADHDPSLTGTALCTIATRVNNDQQTEAFAQVQIPALTVYPALWAQHATHDPAQSTGYRMPMTGDGPDWDAATVVKSNATLFAPVPSVLGDDVDTPAKTASYDLINGADPDFPFATPDDASDQGWVLARRFTGFTPWAQPNEEHDALDIPSAILHGANGLGVVAHVKNTSMAGMVATFFQDWERLDRLTTDGRYDPDCCVTGTRALRLSAGQSVTAGLTPDRAQRYVAALRYRTDSGTATLTLGEATMDLPTTGTNWSYVTLPLDAPANALTLSVTVASGGDVWLDSLAAFPLASQPSFQLQDPNSFAETTHMDGGGRCTRILLDPASDPIGAISPTGALHDLRVKGYGRAVSADDRLDPAMPNSTLALQCAGGGDVDGFRDGGTWATRWTATGDCTAADGRLSMAAGSGLTASDPRFTTPQDSAETCIASIELQHAASGLDFDVTFGDVTLGWSSAGLSTSAGTLLAAPRTCPNHWIFVRTQAATLFYGDGQLLLSLPDTGPRLLTLTANAPLTLRRLALGYDIRLGVTFTDGGGRNIQAQQVWGADSTVVDSLCDTTNRQIATTKPCPASYGSGAALPPMAYRPGTVDRPAFAATWDTTAAMTGDVSDYYSGAPWQGLTPSDDGGYPYYGIRYEASSRDHKTEMSSPGTRHALNTSVPAADRETLQLSTSATWETPPPAPGTGPDFGLEDARTASGLTYRKTTGKLGQVMALDVGTAQGDLLMRTTTDRLYSDTTGPQASLTLTLPRSNGNDTIPAEPGFDRVQVQDGQGRTLSISEPNSGDTQIVMDSTGAIRFVLPRMGADEAFCQYRKYDRCGRQIEEGTLSGTWTVASLAAHADDPDWPATSDPATNRAAWTGYDGDGSDPLQIGQKITTTRVTPDPVNGDVTVIDTYSYDQQALIATATRQIGTAPEAQATLRYAYNTLGQVLWIGLPDDAPIPQLAYTYTDQGQTATIRNATTDTLLASFTYGPDAKLASQQIHGNHSWTRSLTYTSDERPLSLVAEMDGANPTLRLDYSYTADGSVDTRAIDLNGTQANDSFAYDPTGAITEVDGANQASYGPPDLNGNLPQLTEGGLTSTFALAAGTDQIATITTGSGAASSCAWNARGAMVSGNGRSFAYDPSSGRSTQVTQGTTTTTFAYGGRADRAMKSGPDGAVYYFPGAGSAPLLRLTPAGWDVLVSGPGAMVAFATPTDLYALLTDVQNSLLLATDSAGGVAQTNLYRAFGSANPDLTSPERPVPYQFQGQEWDAETGLYNFNARLYDPALARFHAVDPKLQFSSPYLFEANAPINQTDPNGQISKGGQIAIGVGSAALAIGGIALTIATVGTGSAVATGMEAAAVSAEAALAGAEATTESMAAAAEVATAAEDIAAISDMAEAAQVEAGIQKATATTLRSSLKTAKRVTTATRLVSGVVTGVGSAGATYAKSTDNKDFSMKGFATAAAIGGAGSMISGLVFAGEGPLLDMAIDKWPMKKSTEIGVRILASTLTTVALSDVSQLATNIVQDEDWSKGMVQSTLSGAVSGFISASGGALVSAAGGHVGKSKTDFWYERARQPATDQIRLNQAPPANHPANQPPNENTALLQARQNPVVPDYGALGNDG